MKRYKCHVCGDVFDVADGEEAVCPICNRRGDALEEISVAQSTKNAEPAFDKTAMYKLTYGLFVLTTMMEGRDNGCIVNTVMQVSSTPNRIALSVNKGNYTERTLRETGVCNVCVLSQDAPFELFKRFGFASGRDTDKFASFTDYARTENGLTYLTAFSNAVFSLKVISSVDSGSHTLFLCEITGGKTLSPRPSVTYEYYQEHIKPKPASEKSADRTVWRCKVCGYEYEGEELPDDFICPLCKHGAEDFEKV